MDIKLYSLGLLLATSTAIAQPQTPTNVNLDDVTLTWVAPTTNEDGTPLTDLDRYRIYETTGGTRTLVADIPAFNIDIRCWVVTAVDTSNNESADSNEACKEVGTTENTSYTLNLGN